MYLQLDYFQPPPNPAESAPSEPLEAPPPEEDEDDPELRNDPDIGDYQWLMTSAGDANFKSALQRAKPFVLRAVLEDTDGKPGNKLRRQAIQRRLKQMGEAA